MLMGVDLMETVEGTGDVQIYMAQGITFYHYGLECLSSSQSKISVL